MLHRQPAQDTPATVGRLSGLSAIVSHRWVATLSLKTPSASPLRAFALPLALPAPRGAGRRNEFGMAISDISAPTAVKKGTPCGVCSTLDSLDDGEAAALRQLLSDKTWRYTELSDRLRDEGVSLASWQLGRHARGGCDARERLR